MKNTTYNLKYIQHINEDTINHCSLNFWVNCLFLLMKRRAFRFSPDKEWRRSVAIRPVAVHIRSQLVAEALIPNAFWSIGARRGNACLFCLHQARTSNSSEDFAYGIARNLEISAFAMEALVVMSGRWTSPLSIWHFSHLTGNNHCDVSYMLFRRVPLGLTPFFAWCLPFDLV